MNKKDILYYAYGYLKFLSESNNSDEDLYIRLNIMIARYSKDKLIRSHRRYQNNLNRVIWDIEDKIGHRNAFPELYSNQSYNNNDDDDGNDNYNPDLDLDQQHPDFYV